VLDPAQIAVALGLQEHLTVLSLDLEGQGVAHRADGKVVFIDGALPYEVVSARIHRSKSSFDKGTLTEVHRESSQRVVPHCPHFGLHEGACGGCKMQHLHPAAQVAIKQRALEDQFHHIGKLRPDRILRAIEGPAWAYRYRARLSVRFVRKKGAVLIGFHERKSHFVADMKRCPVLPQHVSDMLLPLRDLIAGMDAVQHIPQIELAIGDRGGPASADAQGDVTALVLRHLLPLSDADRDRMRAFALERPGLQWWLQAKGPDTIALLDPAGEARTGALAYSLPDFGITMPFRPTDFTQVNPHINRVLVARALSLLAVQKNERVIDWFCGLGNFTLPPGHPGARGTRRGGRRVAGGAITRQLPDESSGSGTFAKSCVDTLCGAQFVRNRQRSFAGRWHGRQMAGGPAARRCVCPGAVFGRSHARSAKCRRLDAPATDCVCQLQPRHLGPRCCCVGKPGRLWLHSGRGGQYVCPYRARGKHCGI
jgi:23S rRNA (uracil-5-)-methyltransferase RumA